jgi:hypothetical protein
MAGTRALASTVLALALAACGSSANAPPAPAGAPSCDAFPMPNPAGANLPRPASYTANDDGTVTDDVTGLVWQVAVDTTALMRDDAAARCAAKGDGWRLPTRLELVSLVDFTIPGPGPTIAPVFANTPPAVFWTSSPYYGDAGDGWYVGFDTGYSDYGIVNQSYLVRCMRAPAPRCLTRRYHAQAGGDVFDQATGLVWQQALDPKQYSWGDALATCASLGPGWRVPSLKEAQTIIDDGREFPAVDPDAFPGTPSEDFWTSTLKAGGGGAAWYIDDFYGATDADTAARLFRVRCVR